MGRSQESFNKKEVRSKKQKKRKAKEKNRLEKKESGKASMDDMIAYVDENGMITDTPPDPEKKTEINPEDIEIGVTRQEEGEGFDPVRIGTVTFFNESKGYGFIRDIETKESVFLHINNTLDPVIEGNLVSFEVEKGPKGLAAVKVRLQK